MSDQYKPISDSVRRSGEEISKAISGAAHRERRYVDPDLLTAEEVDELRILMGSDDVAGTSRERCAKFGSRLSGMYHELSELGFILASGDTVVRVLPMGCWAVEKHDQRERGRLAERRDGRIWSAIISLASVIVGWLLGLISAGVLTSLR